DPRQALPIALSDRPELDQDAVGAAPMTRPSTTTESQRRRGPDARAPVCRDLRRATACAEIEQYAARSHNDTPAQNGVAHAPRSHNHTPAQDRRAQLALQLRYRGIDRVVELSLPEGVLAW